MQITSATVTDLRIKFGILSLLICFLFTLFVEVDHDKREKTAYYLMTHLLWSNIIFVLSLLQLAGTVLFVGLWLISRTHIALAKAANNEAP